MKTLQQLTDELHAAFIAYVFAAREELKNCDALSSFRFQIGASGRINDGEMNIGVSFSDYAYTAVEALGEGGVKGGKIDNTLEEFLRRNGWKQRNDMLMLSPPSIEHEPVQDTVAAEEK